MRSGWVRSAGGGLTLGVVAGCATALVDYGAHWLWLERWADRAGLLLRLLGLLGPIAGLVGAAAGAWFAATQPAVERLAARMRSTRPNLACLLSAARWGVLVLPLVFWIAQLLFTGGKMSRLPARPLLVLGAFAVMSVAVTLALYLAHRVELRTRSDARLRRRWALAAAGTGVLLCKLNQWLLPKLYDYLHAALAGGTTLLFAAAVYLVLTSFARRAQHRATAGSSGLRAWFALAASLMLSAGCLSWTLASLDGNQNVRVALLHPNMPHARAAMQGLAPFVLEPAQRRATEQARRRARQVRSETRRLAPSAGPVLDDAHIVFVTVDAMRADHLGLYGYTRPTSPNLDRLAQESVVFERAYAPAPHSSFSLCSLMTSEYLHETLDLGNPAPKATLATELAAAGYHTAAFYTAGIFHTAAERLSEYEQGAFGFAFHDQVKYSAQELTDRVLQEADRTVARGEPNSFFWVHYFDVHEPYESTYFGSADVDRYDSEIRDVDAQLERLVRELRRRFTRDVILVVSADHGEEFYEHGGVYHGSSLYEEQIRVPLLIHAPGLPARRVTAPVTTLDLAPTLLHFVGLRAPASMRGGDLRGHVLGQPHTGEPVFAAVIHKKMVVRWPHKLIADLRFGLFELYDLERDPNERHNLADRHPEVVAPLRDEIYGWLDSLSPVASEAADAAVAALEWGRLLDRRAVEPLCKLVTDPQVPGSRRIEAAQLLGHLADDRATPSLIAGMADPDPRVAAEAAIALGRMYDPRARRALQRLIASEDAALRVRAAISLGRLRDTRAVPALVDALWIAPSDYERQEAVRWLGRLRDRRALEPLIQLLPEVRTRYLVPVAIGMLGDPRGYLPLADVLTWDNHADVRDATVQGLGQLGNPRAIPLIVPLATEDASLKLAAEALVRLGAIRRGAIGGADLNGEARSNPDFASCHDGPLVHDWDFQHRTTCTTRTAGAIFPLAAPRAVIAAPYGALAVLGIRRTDANRPARVEVSIGARTFDSIEVDASWNEFRWELPAGALHGGKVLAKLHSTEDGARFELDHLLLLPRNSEVLARH